MIEYQVKNTNLLIKKMKSLAGGKVNNDLKVRVLRAAGAQLKRDVKRNVTRTDYSLDALASMDHPYARRHGSIKVHPGKPYVIHRQSGTFSSNITTKLKTSGEPTWTIGFKYGAKRYFRYLITGTRVMLPRNVIYDTSQNEKTRSDMVKAVNGVFRREIKKLERGV